MWMWTGFIWLKLGTSGSEHMNEPFRLGISRLSEQLLASEGVR